MQLVAIEREKELLKSTNGWIFKLAFSFLNIDLIPRYRLLM